VSKIDSGAYSCSIHCNEIHLNDDGTVHFKLLDRSHPDYSHKHIVMPVYKIKTVRSSNGTMEKRIFIKTALELFGRTFKTELSLTDRKDMKYPMLIGRKFLKKRFLVDVSLKFQSPKKGTNQ
jgi:hypothetical protein